MESLRARLQRGDSLVGTMVSLFAQPQIASIVKSAGFDYFIIDCEHGPFDYSNLAGILLLARESGIPAIVRIPEPRREIILKCMEMGATGLLMPNTETAEQAKILVQCAKYAPMGNRGVALMREHTSFVKPADVADYMRQVNEETILMIQIESTRGLENMDQILDVDGIDIAFVGPADLTQSMGIMGQLESPLFEEALKNIISTANSKGKYSGIHLMDMEKLKYWMKEGMTCNLFNSDVNLIMLAAKTNLEKLRA